MGFFSKRANYKKRVYYYLFSLVFLILLIIVQLNYDIKSVFLTHFNNLLYLNIKTDCSKDISYQNIAEQNIILQAQLQQFKINTNINNIANKKYKQLSKLNVEYISINQNGAFIIALTDSNDVRIGDLVLDKNSFLIGKIVNFNKALSLVKIQMIIDYKSFIPVKTQKGSVYGILSANHICENGISFDEYKGTIENGDIVMTSGEENLTPQGILVGKIEEQDGVYCVKHFSNIQNIDNIYVIRTNSYQELEKLIQNPEN